MEFFWFSIQISRNYVSIIITIISNNITVFVSNNAIFFECFMSMGHGANKKTHAIVPQHYY